MSRSPVGLGVTRQGRSTKHGNTSPQKPQTEGAPGRKSVGTPCTVGTFVNGTASSQVRNASISVVMGLDVGGPWLGHALNPLVSAPLSKTTRGAPYWQVWRR